jgi:hypothetical protein
MFDFSEIVMGVKKGCSQPLALLQGLHGCATELAAGPVFVVSEVLNASGGRTGCFLFRGRLVSAAPRAATPDYCCPALHGGDGVLAGVQEVPQLAQCDSEGQDLLQYEGQQLTLYFSYEEASPKLKQRVSAARAAAAPWRAIMRDENDEMIFSVRGLPEQVAFDEELQLAAWGPDLTVAFPTSKDAAAFAAGLVRVAVQPCSLADTPAAAVVAQAAAEAALSCLAAAAGKAAGSCPASPDLAGQPLVAGKRKAEAAGLQTPVVRPLKLAIITPTCSGDLAALLN